MNKLLTEAPFLGNIVQSAMTDIVMVIAQQAQKYDNGKRDRIDLAKKIIQNMTPRGKTAPIAISIRGIIALRALTAPSYDSGAVLNQAGLTPGGEEGEIPGTEIGSGIPATDDMDDDKKVVEDSTNPYVAYMQDQNKLY